MKHIGKLAAASALFLMQASNAVWAETTMRFSIWLPPTHPLVADVLVPFAEDIEKVTENRVKVEILPAPLGAPPAHYDLVKNGVVDLAQGNQAYTPGRFKTMVVGELPFLGDTAEATSVAYWRTWDAMLKDAGEYDDVHVLSVFTHGPGGAFFKNPDIDSVDQINGLKMRVGGGVAHEVATTLGAAPVEGPSSKAYELLSQGVADGIFFPLESVKYFNLDSLLSKGLMVPGGLYNTSFFMIMGKNTWESLSEEDKAAIDKISGEALARKAGQMWDRIDGEAREAMAGTVAIQQISDADMAALKEKLQPVIEKGIEEVSSTGIDGQAAYEMMKAEVAKVSAE
ncbi:TRAP transporter substrate-binding protein [Martelella soudanensis]|uniref:TRAP transporter substrate-binding protein n=1 Tax=unclassified Martelella TaxID=2629616 RepID=UPI0015DEAC9A|nr:MULTISPECIES: TRAP transporter substrate-binding protein [unclassified Martelella]